MNRRAGFKEEIYDGVFEPRRVNFFEAEGLSPLRVSCGFDHTLILFEEAATKHHKIYTVGQNETSYHHLGLTDPDQEEPTVFFREVTAFRGFSIVDIAAGHRSSHAIIEGDKEVLSGLHEHKMPNG